MPSKHISKKRTTKNKSVLKVFESFAGYGGASFALNRLNFPFEVVGYSEIDKNAIKVYEINHPGVPNYGDITLIDETTLPDFDLFTGGFCCQSFSSIGKNLGEYDIRGTLFNDIIRIVKYKRPNLILLENVKGLVSKTHINTLTKIINELEDIGYDVQYKVLNSKDYNIPQNRERVWIFATLCKQFENVDIYPLPLEQTIDFLDIVDEFPDERLYLTQEQILHKMDKTGIDFDVEKICIINSYHIKIKYADYSWTLLTSMDSYNIIEPKIKKEYRVRRFSVDECYRLMGFEDGEIDFADISYAQAIHLAGNGWDINVVSLILQNILTIYYNCL